MFTPICVSVCVCVLCVCLPVSVPQWWVLGWVQVRGYVYDGVNLEVTYLRVVLWALRWRWWCEACLV
jgi:hypothetical protein